MNDHTQKRGGREKTGGKNKMRVESIMKRRATQTLNMLVLAFGYIW